MSFWFGFSFRDLASTPLGAIQMYLHQLEAMTAELSLLLAETAAFPHLDDAARRRRRDEWTRLASRGKLEIPRPTMPAILRLHGIGVTFVPKKKETAKIKNG